MENSYLTCSWEPGNTSRGETQLNIYLTAVQQPVGVDKRCPLQAAKHETKMPEGSPEGEGAARTGRSPRWIWHWRATPRPTSWKRMPSFFSCGMTSVRMGIGGLYLLTRLAVRPAQHAPRQFLFLHTHVLPLRPLLGALVGACAPNVPNFLKMILRGQRILQHSYESLSRESVAAGLDRRPAGPNEDAEFTAA